ncbi:hypothetical protein GCM10027321_05430 [Massilia terrae]|uniref:Uncharacterized protein n=1 Tax=Massilia terrae TaxID=1811224 RepID=A0ABT2CT11_9BURK|nr:hypothetical protein [Massilia terrae]MCS0657097.1 hypothetical protein [Massilia terrae]
MTQQRILIAILLVMLLAGGLDATFNARGESLPLALTAPLTLAINFLCFLWYRRDSDVVGYRRSPWLNVCVILLVFIGIPYYLLRSREQGRKLLALAKCLGFGVLMVLADAVGMVLSGHPIS